MVGEEGKAFEFLGVIVLEHAELKYMGKVTSVNWLGRSHTDDFFLNSFRGKCLKRVILHNWVFGGKYCYKMFGRR